MEFESRLLSAVAATDIDSYMTLAVLTVCRLDEDLQPGKPVWRLGRLAAVKGSGSGQGRRGRQDGSAGSNPGTDFAGLPHLRPFSSLSHSCGPRGHCLANDFVPLSQQVNETILKWFSS